jgi:hypothetical protein
MTIPQSENRIRITNWLAVLMVLLLPLVFLNSSSIPVNAITGEGSLQLSVQGYGTVHGQLHNAIVQSNNNISMSMFVTDHLQTSQGSFPVTATGTWTGVLTGISFSGSIQDIVGKISICILFSCNDANFVGQGQWIGSLDGNSATGSFTGTLTFTNSPVPQIPVNQPLPVSGSWTADFQLPIPEFGFEWVVYIVALVATVVALNTHRLSRDRQHFARSST